MTSDKPTVYEAVILVRQDVGPVARSQRSQGRGSYAYRGHETVVNALDPHMTKHGVHVLPVEIQQVAAEWTENSQGNIERMVSAVYVFEVTGPAGDSFRVPIYAEGMNQRDKGAGSALTYAHRRALEAVFNLPTGDADVEENNEPAGPRRAQQRPQRRAGHDDSRKASRASQRPRQAASDESTGPREQLVDRFMRVTDQRGARDALQEVGLFPVLDVPDDRIPEALAILEGFAS